MWTWTVAHRQHPSAAYSSREGCVLEGLGWNRSPPGASLTLQSHSLSLLPSLPKHIYLLNSLLWTVQFCFVFYIKNKINHWFSFQIMSFSRTGLSHLCSPGSKQCCVSLCAHPGCVYPEADPETEVWVQVISVGGDSRKPQQGGGKGWEVSPGRTWILAGYCQYLLVLTRFC